MKSSVILVLATLSAANGGLFDAVDDALPANGGLLDAVDDVLPITTTFHLETDGHRMVETIEVNTYFGGKKTVDCYMYGDSYIIDQMVKLIPTSLTKQVDKDEMSELVNQCSDLLLNQISTGVFHVIESPFDSIRKAFKSLLIFPGTKWCGAGNVADDYDDLGRAEDTDKCCRTHDNCDDSIARSETKYDLTNSGLFTISSCECDSTFHSCLRDGDNLPSDLVGKVFFNILQAQCFKNDYPQIGCLEKSGIPLIRESCQEYELDYNATKKYQFFDAKAYESKENASILDKLNL